MRLNLFIVFIGCRCKCNSLEMALWLFSVILSLVFSSLSITLHNHLSSCAHGNNTQWWRLTKMTFRLCLSNEYSFVTCRATEFVPFSRGLQYLENCSCKCACAHIIQIFALLWLLFLMRYLFFSLSFIFYFWAKHFYQNTPWQSSGTHLNSELHINSCSFNKTFFIIPLLPSSVSNSD